MLTYINHGNPIPRELSTQIEDFFQYYWTKDRVKVFKQPDDKKIVDEIEDSFMQ